MIYCRFSARPLQQLSENFEINLQVLQELTQNFSVTLFQLYAKDDFNRLLQWCRGFSHCKITAAIISHSLLPNFVKLKWRNCCSSFIVRAVRCVLEGGDSAADNLKRLGFSCIGIAYWGPIWGNLINCPLNKCSIGANLLPFGLDLLQFRNALLQFYPDLIRN